MRLIFVFLISFMIIFPLGCISYNPVHWVKGKPEERSTYDASGHAVTKKPGGVPESPEDALRPQRPTSPPPEIAEEVSVLETSEKALVVTPMGGALVEEEVVAAEEFPVFTIIYYARGPASRARGAPSDKPSSRLYKMAKKTHMTHNLEKGPYAAYYQEVRKRVKSHWNFLYSDVNGINYKTSSNLPVIVDATIYPTGIISDVNIVNTAGNPVLAALAKGAIETALVDRFPPGIKADFISLRFQYYFED